MNFTREPIIETVITPREGSKLLVRNSKQPTQEEYQVEALEVVSFGNSLFFRCQERTKPFLVPVTDYEVIETKEVRVALKNAPQERSIKIGGGREAPVRPPREPQPISEAPAESSDSEPSDNMPPRPQHPGGDNKKRDRRRSRRRRSLERHDSPEGRTDAPLAHEPPSESSERSEEAPAPAPSFISKLFPPPPTLIRDNISRYKPQEGHPPKPEETLFEHPETDGPVED